MAQYPQSISLFRRFLSLLTKTGNKPKSWKCKHLRDDIPISDRQERIIGWDQTRIANTTVLCVGAGGLGGEILEGLTKKGYGYVHVADHDIVTPTNLNRQKFKKQDLFKNKAHRLSNNGYGWGFLGTTLISHPCKYQDLDFNTLDPKPDIIFGNVDNQFADTRLRISQDCHIMGIPCILLGVTPDAGAGYVFVQKSGETCWNCIFKTEMQRHDSNARQCPGSPASIDILKVLGGLALYAADSLLMSRPCDWNYWYVSLGQSDFGGPELVKPRCDCIVCGGQQNG